MASSSGRRQSVQRQLQSRSLAFEFFDALDGQRGKALFEHCNEHSFIVNTGRRPLPGEIGCFASHKSLWNLSVEKNRPMLIMEDDFHAHDGFESALRTATALIDDVGFLRLQFEEEARRTLVMDLGDFRLERYIKPPQCAMCYALAPWIAQRLLKYARDFDAPVDVVMKRFWEFGHPMYCLTPYVVRNSDSCRESVIGKRQKCSKSPTIRMQRVVRKAANLIQRLRFNRRWSDAPLRQRLSKRQEAAAEVQDPG
jgi:glycosyl transferase, family 25